MSKTDEVRKAMVEAMKAKDKEITNCEIHSNTKFIYEYAFDRCDSLTSIVIPDSVKDIDYCAFNNCKSLTSITLPSSLKYLNSFPGCTSIVRIDFRGTVEQWMALNKSDFWYSSGINYTVYCTDGTITQ